MACIVHCPAVTIVAASVARSLIRQIGHLPISGLRAASFQGISVVDIYGTAFRFGGLDRYSGTTLISPVTGEIRILVNSGPSASRRLNWTVAHEVGHVALGHIQEEGYPAISVARAAFLDRQANAFAAELLMPTELVLYAEPRWSVARLAQWCGVSPRAAAIRIEEVHQNLDILRDGGLDLVKLCRRPKPTKAAPEPPWVRAVLEFVCHEPRETEIQRIERELIEEENWYSRMYVRDVADSAEGR